jgi:tetratricopeptide (TPR) repeat protein
MLEAFDHGMRSAAAAHDGDLDEARRLVRSQREITDSLGLPALVAASYQTAGYAEWIAGDTAAAETAYRWSAEITKEQADESHASTLSAMWARMLCELERFEEADRLAVTAGGLGAEEDVATQAITRSVQALVRSARGEFREAERLAREAVAQYEETGAQNPGPHGDAWFDLARVLDAAGKTGEAAEAAKRALALYEAKGIVPRGKAAYAFIDART